MNRRSGSTAAASGGGSGMLIAPATVGSPGRHSRKISGASRETVTGSAVAKPCAASAATSASVSGSSRMG